MAKKTNTEQTPLFTGLDLDQIHPVETVTEELAEKYLFETVDFADPNRSKTCIEIDFPILKVNEISAKEQNAPKPIYSMSKWWARRRASIFRQLLISSATKAPQDEGKAAQASWALMYHRNHKRHAKFSKLKVLDVFMGGGTTVIEAARLGFNVTGIDLNPIAWWVVKNESTPIDIKKISDFSDYIIEVVKPQILPFYTTNSPRGFKSRWVVKKTGETSSINIFDIPSEERNLYNWEGPEIVYTFWMKHILCSDPTCFHLTPQANTSVVAQKNIKIKYLENCVCPSCGNVFDLEFGGFKMAPAATFVLGDGEKSFATLGPQDNSSACPHCMKKLSIDWISTQEKNKETKRKEVNHSILLPKKWLKGISGKSKNYFGGFPEATLEQDETWLKERSADLELIEVRGDVPSDLQFSSFGKKIGVDNASRPSTKIICGSCGLHQEPLSSIKMTDHPAPVFPYMIQGFDPEAKEKKFLFSGRFFDIPNKDQIIQLIKDFDSRKDIKEFIPEENLFYGHQTHQRTNLPAHGYKKWKDMFNPRQLYTHALLLKAITNAPKEFDNEVKSHVLGAFQQYLRYNCMFSFYQSDRDLIIPHFSNNDFHPKATPCENSPFSFVGAGTFQNCLEKIKDGMAFLENPYEVMVQEKNGVKLTKKIPSKDKISNDQITLYCGSSTDLKDKIVTSSIDLVITDPPFGDNVNYSELADFFLVWLNKPLSKIYPDVFGSSESPKTLEAVTNKARHPGTAENGEKKADVIYDRLLTLCWKEAFRVLQPSGLLVFTFHHDKDEAWIGVLDSLFKSGFIIESAFPIRSDGARGDGDFGSKKIEYDIVHVCKKRHVEPIEIFWATLRKRILNSVKSRSLLLAQHKQSGLHLADLEVIIRGEVLEQYSYHYGKVKKNIDGDLVTVREILIEANNIAQALLQSNEQEKVPDAAEPETKIYFSLFRDAPSIEFNAARKRLKGSGTSLEELEGYGWVTTGKIGKEKISSVSNISERWISLSRKKHFSSDLDQVHFAINCCVGGKQLDGKPADLETWIESNYKSLLPSVVPLLKYMEGNHFGAEYKQAIGMAYRTIDRTLNKIKETDGEFKRASDQLSLFE